MRRLGLAALLLAAVLWLGAAGTMAAALPEDGDYTVAVSLSGGSGRAGVDSPAPLTVAEGEAVATLRWSSPHYEWMLVDGIYYYPEKDGESSVFAIPVRLDQEMAVSAQTVAMSEPHVIKYTLRFDRDSLTPLAEAKGFSRRSVVFVAVGVAVLLVAARLALLRKAYRRLEAVPDDGRD